MSFAAMMVHVDLDAPCDARIRLAASLATRFQSTLIGVGASQPPSPLTYGGVVVDPQPTPEMIHELVSPTFRIGRALQRRRRMEPASRVALRYRFADALFGGRGAGRGPRHHRARSRARRFLSRARSERIHIESRPTGTRRSACRRFTAGGEHCGRLEGNAGGATGGSGCDALSAQGEPRMCGGM